jgi:hypothetical protein
MLIFVGDQDDASLAEDATALFNDGRSCRRAVGGSTGRAAPEPRGRRGGRRARDPAVDHCRGECARAGREPPSTDDGC